MISSWAGHVLSLPSGPSYGPELVTNGTFDTDTTGWSSLGGLLPDLFEWNAGRLHISNDGSSRSLSAQSAGMAVTAGESYAYSMDVEIVSGCPAISINAFNYSTGRLVLTGQDSLAPGTYTLSGTFNCAVTENVHFIMDYPGDAVSRDVFYDNVSLKVIL